MKTELLHILRTANRAVSGQELCEKFGVSRTAIWKVIGQLKDEGYEIVSVTNRGYELIGTPDHLTRHELESRLWDCAFGHEVLAFDRVTSTNQVLKEGMDDRPHGLLAVAEEQTMGKGRRGRAWQSPPGTGIWMSLLIKDLHRTECAPMVTLVAALAVRQAIEEMLGRAEIPDGEPDGTCEEMSVPEIFAGKPTDMSGEEEAALEHDTGKPIESAATLPQVQIKWPNDIVIGGKKVCGILTEMVTEVDYLHGIIVGIGINVHQAKFPPEIAQTATSLYLATGRHPNRPELAERILRGFEKKYDIFSKDQDLRSLRGEYNRALANAGKQIRVLDGEDSFNGIGVGIDDGGRLLVETPEGMKTVRSGEVSVRGIYGYV
ncbi:MAG: biotin--[acetyl-CoA-carboxylase] ligase [Lachnospiraceae bacterium]|nr:biotin--[acetyl-CoA-carboxylase] ligase [Lachnospiraceae bacterium]